MASLDTRFCAKIKSVMEQLASLGIEARVIGTLRTIAEQDALYAQGRTTDGPIVTHARGGRSYHNWGLACDLDYSPSFSAWDKALVDRVSHVAVVAGLVWGGTWGFQDEAHWEDRSRGTVGQIQASGGIRPGL